MGFWPKQILEVKDMEKDDFISFIENDLGLNLTSHQKRLINEFIIHSDSRIIVLPKSHDYSVTTEHLAQMLSVLVKDKQLDLYKSENGNLPLKEEYAQSLGDVYKEDRWSKPIYLCPKCKVGGMCRDNSFMYCSLPPQYDYRCNKCGYKETYF